MGLGALSLLISLAGAAQAATGYVVKVEPGAVYIDLGEKAGAAVGRPFFVYTEGEELKHPVDGASLGKVEHSVAEGRVTLVLPAYSVGSLLQGAGRVEPGMRAKLEATTPPAAAPASEAPPRAARWRSPAFPFAVTGLAVADFRGEGKPTLALSDKNSVGLYPYPPESAQPLAQFVHPGAGPRILSLAAADVDGNGRAELFVTLHNETFARAETVVLEWSDGQWRKLADIPWMVRAYQDGEGAQALAMQQLLEDQTYPFSGLYRLSHSDGKYAPGRPLRFKRVEFLYDFTQASLPGARQPALVFQTPTDHVRVQLENGFWRTSGAYGQTPARLRWHGRVLEFHPPMPVGYGADGPAVYLVRNTGSAGGLGEPFALFNAGEIESQSWSGKALAPRWRARLEGYCPALQLVPGARKPSDLAAAVTGPEGSSVWIFDP